MSTEKVIKKQSLNLLSKGNWGNTVVGFLIACIPFILIVLSLGFISAILNIFNFDENSKTYILVDNLMFYASIFVFFEISPIIAGYMRMCYNISKGNDYSLRDLFYYFSNNRHNKCVRLFIAVMIRLILCMIICLIPTACFTVLAYTINLGSLLVVARILAFAGLVVTAIYGLKFTISFAIYFEDEELECREIIKLTNLFVGDKINTLRKIIFSFLPHILLCFFVVPLIYVVPYVTMALMTNGKWVVNIYKTPEQD